MENQTKMWLSFVLFSALLDSAIAFHSCGGHYCIQKPGVYCSEDKCFCPIEEIGDGHIQCVHGDTRSLCIIFGDPHIISFGYEFFRLPLPCHATLAEFVTPGNEYVPAGCAVHVTGRGTFVDGTPTTYTSYERVLYITVTSTGNQFRAQFGQEGIDWKELVKLEGYDMYGHTGRFFVNTGYDMNEFVYMEIPYCGIYIKFRYHDGSFAIDKPIGSEGNDGICGTLRFGLNSSSPRVYPNASTILLRDLESLTNVNPIDQTNPNIYPECTALTNTYSNCTSSHADSITKHCMLVVEDEETNNCLVLSRGIAATVGQLDICLHRVCVDNVDPCTILSEVFGECVNSTAVQHGYQTHCSGSK